MVAARDALPPEQTRLQAWVSPRVPQPLARTPTTIIVAQLFLRQRSQPAVFSIDAGNSTSVSANGEYSVSSAAFTSHAGTSTVDLTEIAIRGGAASNLAASGTQDAVASAGVASVGTSSASSVVRGLAVEVDGCQVRATGDSSVASLGVAMLSGGSATYSVSGASVGALRSELVSRGSACVANGGCVAHSQSTMRSSAANVTLRCEDAQVLSSGSAAVGSLSFTSYCAAQQEVDVQSLLVCVISSNITTLVSGDCASSVGACACGSASSTTSMAGVSISATASNVSTSGVNSVSSLGTAHSGASLTARDWTVYAERCRIESQGSGDCVSSGGIACKNSASSLLSASNATFVFSSSTVHARGSNGVTSAGLASYGASSRNTVEASTSSTIAASLCTVYSESSTISAIGSGNAIASMGIASFNLCGSVTSSTSVMKVSSTSSVSCANVTIHGGSTQCTASGANSIASMGVASRAAATCRNTYDNNRCSTLPTFTATGASISLTASNSTVKSSGSAAVAALALSSLVSSSEYHVRTCQSDVQCSGSPSDRCACLFSSTADSPLKSTTGSLIAVATRVSAPSSSCISLRPVLSDTGGNVSVLRDVSLACPNVGWSGTCSNCCGSNISVNGSPLTASNVATWFVGLQLNPINGCPIGGGCSEIAPPPMTLPLNTGCAAVRLPSSTPSSSRSSTPSSSASRSRSGSPSPTSISHSPSLTRSDTPSRTQRSHEPSNSTSASLSQDSMTVTWPHEAVAPRASPAEHVLPSGVANVVAQTGSASGAVGGAVGSAASAGAIRRIELVSNVIECVYDEHQIEPSFLQYAVSFELGHEHALSAHAGGMLSSCAFVFVVLIVEAIVERVAGLKYVQYPCRIEAVAHHFFCPSIAEGAILLARHSHDPLDIGVAAVCATVVFGVVAHRAFVVVWRVPREVRAVREPCGLRGTIKVNWEGDIVDRYGPFFTASSDSSSVLVRTAYFVDLSCSVLMACIVGWKQDSGSCTTVASLVVVVSVAMLVYLAVLRPLAHRRALAFATAFATLQVGQAVGAFVITMGVEDAWTPLGVLTLIQVVAAYVQCCVMIGWKGFVFSRHAASEHLTRDATASSVPMLELPSLITPKHFNPLDTSASAGARL